MKLFLLRLKNSERLFIHKSLLFSLGVGNLVFVLDKTLFASREDHPVSEVFIILEIVITRAAPAFHKLFMVMGCVFDINTVHKTVEKLTFQAFH